MSRLGKNTDLRVKLRVGWRADQVMIVEDKQEVEYRKVAEM